jgi:hypothetical protein
MALAPLAAWLPSVSPNRNIDYCNVTDMVSKPKAQFYQLHGLQRLRIMCLLPVKRSAILSKFTSVHDRHLEGHTSQFQDPETH